MPSRTPPPTSGVESRDSDSGAERLVSAAVRLAEELPAGRRVLGVLRGWSRGDRERARLLREGLAHHGVRTVELSAVPDAGERHRIPQSGRRQRHHLLVRAAGPYDQALRAAALQNLPLLTERPSPEDAGGGDAPTLYGAQRHSVIGIHLSGDVLDIAVRRLTITCLQPHPGSACLLIDNEKIATPAGLPLHIELTADGVLRVRSEAIATRRVRRIRYERPWGTYRLDVDGTPAHDVRAPLRLEPLPGRLHLLHP
ncbi:hypothetical protein [Streptomyces sp. NPDC006274]|uniref:hypothetical protein n=1 Tax=unclassified Streptomyces TaxID=2593676 RepID=UPI0033B4704F